MSAPGAPARLVVTAIAWILIGLISAQLAIVLLSIIASRGGDSFGIALGSSMAALAGVIATFGNRALPAKALGSDRP